MVGETCGRALRGKSSTDPRRTSSAACLWLAVTSARETFPIVRLYAVLLLMVLYRRLKRRNGIFARSSGKYLKDLKSVWRQVEYNVGAAHRPLNNSQTCQASMTTGKGQNVQNGHRLHGSSFLQMALRAAPRASEVDYDMLL